MPFRLEFYEVFLSEEDDWHRGELFNYFKYERKNARHLRREMARVGKRVAHRFVQDDV